ncbi:MAG: SMP-30/gluconolactonase/LRE family protein [Anaerolineae bacterium]|nr:SMP-30/gluconolactonase/LRE family protein [Anaerolineae bacterium]
MTSSIEVAVQVRATLGEGPIWDEREQVLYWVDIRGNALYRYNPATGENQHRDVGQPVGTVVLRENGGLLLAVKEGFAFFDWESGTLEMIANPQGRAPGTRFNDGKAGPAGHFWAGDMHTDGDPCEGKLFVLKRDLSVHTAAEEYCIPNGIVWTHDHRTMYHIDTPRRIVHAYDYDLESGTISNQREAFSVPSEMGFPDGMAIDAEGMLWIAHYDGSSVRRWHPHTGEVLLQISLPVSQVTACAFGGENLTTLYITTASQEYTEEDFAREPLAGSLFVAESGVEGTATYRFAG